MQSMACMFSRYVDSADRTITPMISGIRIGDSNCYGYHPPVIGAGSSAPNLGNGGSLVYQRDNHDLVYQRDSHDLVYQRDNLDLKTDPDRTGSFYRPAQFSEGVMDSSPGSQSSSSAGSTGGRNRKNKEDKVCGVCGDKALGFNFDAISCESCKAFFRRNAPKGLSYFKCPYDEKCKMDLSNRRFCKRCRLKKCFEIGMRKEYILTEDEKAQKRQKIEENRYLKKLNVGANPNSRPSNDDTESADDSGDAEKVSPYQQASLQPSLTHSPLQPSLPLSTEDSAAINDLHIAYRNSLEVNMDKHVSRDQADFSALVNIAELSVRRVIAMAKQVPAFKTLPQVEQIHLLKGGSIELLILRSVITFDKEKQHFLDPVDQEETKAMNLEQLQHAETGLGLFEDHMKFVRSLAMDLEADVTTLILLLVISLFSPDRENLEFKDLVAAEQEKFSLLLKNYLESIYPLAFAKALFPKLLMKLTDIRNLNEEHSQVLLKVKPEGIQPLMKEVLDLSC